MRGGRNTRAIVALVMVVGALAAAAAVQASIPDAAGVIHGCYKTNQGTLRVIDSDAGQACANSEAPLNWNQTGPEGPQGPQGPQGPPGPKGDPGATYAAGTGLSLSGNTFSVAGSYQLPQGCLPNQTPYLQDVFPSHPWGCFNAVNAGENCAKDNYQTGSGPDGDINCAAIPDDDPIGPDGYVTRHPESQDTPQNGDATVATLSLPNGSFLLTAHGIADNDGGADGDPLILHCWFGPVGFSFNRPYATVHGDGGPLEFNLTDIVTLSSSADVTLVCTDSEPNSNVQDIQMTAVQLGSATTQ